MNYYPFHIGDYASATRHLSWDEDLAYRRLIDAYYTKEAPIPADKRAAYRLVCATTDAQREAVDVVLAEFFFLSGDVWIHDRCEAEIHAATVKREKASQSAKVRWSNANAERTKSEGNANASAGVCERINESCEGNAPNPNPNPNISTDVDIKPKREKTPRFDAQAHLVSLGVDSQVANDWLSHRKAKKATPTLTAIDGIIREAAKARIALSDALSLSCQRGWVGFEADWIAKDQPRNGKSQYQINQDATARALFGNSVQAEPRLIQGEVVQ